MSETADDLRRRLAALEAENRALRAQLHAPPSDEAPTAELLEALLRTNISAVVVLDPAGRIRWANDRAEQLLGVTRSALLDRMHDDAGWRITDEHGQDMPDEKTPFRRVRTEGRAISAMRATIEWPDGARRVLSINGAPVRGPDGEVRSLVFSFEGVTDLLAAERRARESEEALQAALRAARVGTWRWELATNEVSWSDDVEAIMGLAPGTFAGTYEAYLALIPDDERPRLLRAIERSLAGETEGYSITHTIRPPGGLRSLACRGDVLRDAAGRPTRMTGTVTDVTDRMRLEDQLRQAARVESVGRLAGGVAHDVNNILTAIRGFTELAARALPPNDPAAAHLRAAGDAVDRGAALTRQLLTFARGQVGRHRVIDAGEAIRRARPVIARLLREDIELEVELAPAPTPVSIDPVQLEQVLLNLAANARDAMPRGGRLTVTTRVARLDAAAVATRPGLSPGDHLALTVRDTGEGISPEVRERLFEPFFTTKPPGQGTGLGLPACYGIVQERGGHIDVESARGAGAAFVIHLPLAAGPIEPLEPATARLPEANGRGTILVVEDEALIRGVVVACLAGAGFDVLTASDGRAALDLLATHPRPVDLVLSDVVMPRMGGVELARRLRAQHPDVRVLLMSGYAAQLDDPAAVADGFLAKPFAPDDLLKAVTPLVRLDPAR